MKKKMSIAADAGLNATGFYNRKSGSIRVSGAAEEVDELEEKIDELEEVDEEATEVDEATEDGDDVVEEVLAEVKAETAESISELEEDSVSEALDDDEEEDDDTTGVADDEGEGEDDTTSVADDEATQHPAEVQEKEGDTMDSNNRIAGISLPFLDSIRSYAYEAAVNGKLNSELGKFSLGIIKAYPKSFEAVDITETIESVLKARPELIDEVVDWADAYVEENTLPDYGWRYKAVGILNGKTFDSEAEARNAATDFIQLGHSFEELFVKDLFYKEDGKLTERIPDDSKHRQLIMAQINKSSQPSANPADDIKNTSSAG